MLKLSTRLFVNSFDGVDDDVARVRPTDSTNNMAFVGLHVLDARAYLARYLGLDYQHPFTGLEDVNSIEDLTDYPSVEDILASWREVSGLLALLRKYLGLSSMSYG